MYSPRCGSSVYSRISQQFSHERPTSPSRSVAPALVPRGAFSDSGHRASAENVRRLATRSFYIATSSMTQQSRAVGGVCEPLMMLSKRARCVEGAFRSREASLLDTEAVRSAGRPTERAGLACDLLQKTP